MKSLKREKLHEKMQNMIFMKEIISCIGNGWRLWREVTGSQKNSWSKLNIKIRTVQLYIKTLSEYFSIRRYFLKCLQKDLQQIYLLTFRSQIFSYSFLPHFYIMDIIPIYKYYKFKNIIPIHKYALLISKPLPISFTTLSNKKR